MPGISASSNCIDLINKYNTWCHLCRLFEQISDTGSTHSDIHLYKAGPGHRKEWYICFTCHCFCKQGLTGSRRADKQCPLWQLRSDIQIFLWIVQEIDHLCQRFLSLFLSGNIRKGNTCFLLNVNLRICSTYTAASFHDHRQQQIECNDHYNVRNDRANHGTSAFIYTFIFCSIFCLCLTKLLCQTVIRYSGCSIFRLTDHLIIGIIFKYDLTSVDLYGTNLALI